LSVVNGLGKNLGGFGSDAVFGDSDVATMITNGTIISSALAASTTNRIEVQNRLRLRVPAPVGGASPTLLVVVVLTSSPPGRRTRGTG
jgi:hypothetical protein